MVHLDEGCKYIKILVYDTDCITLTIESNRPGVWDRKVRRND